MRNAWTPRTAWGATTPAGGVVMQRLCILAPGVHTFSFDVRVEVERTPWDGGETIVDSSSLESEVCLEVR